MLLRLLRVPERGICGRVGEHFEEVWKRVESGLLLKEVCSQYVFGFFDGVPARHRRNMPATCRQLIHHVSLPARA